MRGRDLFQLKAFCAVLEHGNFARAAAHLGLSPSALSQIVKDLEERLDLRVLNRTTRSVAATEAGRALYDKIEPALHLLENVDTEVAAQAGRISGTLRLNVSRVAANIYLAPMLGGFLRDHPDVTVDIVTDDRLVDVVADGFDAGIRLGEKLHQDMIAVPLSGDLTMKVVASPAYIARHGEPLHPNDLRRHRCLCYRNPSDRSPYRWEFERGDDRREVAVSGPIIVDEPAMLPRIALEGIGIAYQFSHQVDRYLETGDLVRLLTDWTPPFPGFFVYYPSRRQMAPALRAFVDHVKRMQARA
ncbi:LysR family transcriptional regulator [Rhodobium gokarnense]|uniref:DNA-binding transcriptional LysR family regulator n=1 Tax=Rhodobium gokarnense TaxID=364296 RepID=A0ABT3HAX8_9HYPH|nr:LysR family transcriptional regulator [Rhodobium gokarnense]MCW2307551.1 DNA-binding transcriptional LysR family regulator [Rhodobium gokarnense]